MTILIGLNNWKMAVPTKIREVGLYGTNSFLSIHTCECEKTFYRRIIKKQCPFLKTVVKRNVNNLKSVYLQCRMSSIKVYREEV